jgi:hypothetical protein
MRQPLFKARVCELRGQLSDESIGRLADLLGIAANALRGLLESPDTPARLKHDTAKTIHELYIGISNHAELKADIDALKATITKGK